MKKGEKSDTAWRKKLSPQQYEVFRNKGTEHTFTGKYVKHKKKGVYNCAACGGQLFDSDTKFDSGSGWPSFTDPKNREGIVLKEDYSHGMNRSILWWVWIPFRTSFL